VVGAFPVNPGDQLVLVTDAGKLIRCPVHDIRIAGRSTRGVRLFDVAENERVVSVARLPDDGEANGNGEADEEGAAHGNGDANGNGEIDGANGANGTGEANGDSGGDKPGLAD
jgi:DNA gyrase subunit A